MARIHTDTMKPKHIIWDWNGTLLDDAWLCLEIMNELLARRSLPALQPARYRAIFRFPVRDYYRELGFDFSREPFEHVSTEFITAYYARHHRVALQPHVREVLEAAARAGITQSVLSASKQGYLSEAVRDFGLEPYFQNLNGISDHHAGGKMAVGKAYLAQQNLAPADILLVGDTVHDAEVAQEMGVFAALIPGGHQSRARLAETGAPLFDSLEALHARILPSEGTTA